MRHILTLLLAAWLAPAFAQFGGGGGGGTCAGDLAGVYPNCVVVKLNGVPPAPVATSGSAADLTGKLPVNSAPALSVGTVAALPSCTAQTIGLKQMVTDALTPAPLGNVAGGGSVTVSVTCNGVKWIVQ